MASVQQQNYFPRSSSDEKEEPTLFPDVHQHYGAEDPSSVETELKTSEFKAVVATLFAAVGSLCFGYCIGYSSPALLDLKNKDSSVHLDQAQGSFFASLVTLGAIIGCPLGGVIADFFGRKLTIMFSAIPFEAGWLMIRFAVSPAMLDAGRLVTGIGCGIIAVSYPVYVAEISSSKLRGALGAVHQISLTTGILLSYVVGVFYNWRDIAIGGVIMPVFIVAIMIFMKETPRWYLAHNRRSAALKSLRWLRGDHADIYNECFETERSIDMHTKMSCQEFCKPSITRPLCIGVGLMTFQQMCGAIVIVMNLASIFTRAGFTDAKLVSIGVAGVQLLVNLIACGIVDKVGRRTLLLSMAVVMAFCHFGLGTFFQLSNDDACNSTISHSGTSHSIPSCDISWLAITCIVVFYISFSLSWGPVPWIVMSEVFPLRARGIAGSIATISAFVSAFFLLWCYVYMEKAFTVAGLYWFYGGCCILSFIFVYVLVPETRGQSLEEIEASFEPSRTYEVIE
ncbi:hypothetical protein QZH41_013601 [Actinostola sp. cb2023]|nr:hypothetical protein QZH41_013601 [Actinostola sp. cb2023]